MTQFDRERDETTDDRFHTAVDGDQLGGDVDIPDYVACRGCGYRNRLGGPTPERPRCHNPEPPEHVLHAEPGTT